MYLHVCIDKGMIYMCIDIYIYIYRQIYLCGVEGSGLSNLRA